VLCPNLKAVNKTLLNGEILERSVALREGDIIAIGSETKKDQVLPVRVTFE